MQFKAAAHVAKKLAAILNTTVGYLLDESGQESVLKDPDMLKRLNDIEKMAPAKRIMFSLPLMLLFRKLS